MRIFSLVLLLAFLAACSEPGYSPTVFEIAAGTLLRSGDTVIAQAYLGPNGCYRFHHREIIETDSTLTLRYFGLHDEAPGTACTEALVYMSDTMILSAAQRAKNVRWQ